MNKRLTFGYGEADCACRYLLENMGTPGVAVLFGVSLCFALSALPEDDSFRTGLMMLAVGGYFSMHSNMSAHGYISFSDKFWKHVADELGLELADPDVDVVGSALRALSGSFSGANYGQD